jgi:hypothetical protein
VEQALCVRHAHQRAHLAAPAGLAEDRHVAGIAAEIRDVVSHPFECGDRVEHPNVAGMRVFLAAQFAQIQISEHVEAMIYCHHDDVVLSGKIAAVIHGPVGRGSRVTATVEPHHHGPFAASDTGSPDVQVETILATVSIVLRLLRHGLGNENRRNLRRCGSKLQRVAHSRPRLNFQGRHEASRTLRRSAIRHALKGDGLALHRASDLAGISLRDRTGGSPFRSGSHSAKRSAYKQARSQ